MQQNNVLNVLNISMVCSAGDNISVRMHFTAVQLKILLLKAMTKVAPNCELLTVNYVQPVYIYLRECYH
jgi:hypothetical protein